VPLLSGCARSEGRRLTALPLVYVTMPCSTTCMPRIRITVCCVPPPCSFGNNDLLLDKDILPVEHAPLSHWREMFETNHSFGLSSIFGGGPAAPMINTARRRFGGWPCGSLSRIPPIPLTCLPLPSSGPCVLRPIIQREHFRTRWCAM